MRLTLAADAVRRLDLETYVVGGAQANAFARTVPGEIVAAPRGGGLPVAAGTDLAALAGQQARADADAMRARADLKLAEANLRRASGLVDTEAGSIRARDEATQQVAAAKAALAGATGQRRALGPAVAGMAVGGAIWVRAQVPAADLARIDGGAFVSVRPVGGTGGIMARPVRGPATATPGAASVDVYYAPAMRAGLRVGERVLVDLPEQTDSGAAVIDVPASAILTDINGGEWVYVETAPRQFERRRVEVARIVGGRAMLARGLASGVRVVTAGAAELFGTEFGTK
ncbi:efflux RND transporter periplasmic adaptor subunit [Novosphingobium sp.]|uniref:efflux RND transporter periplasmic adaptor subunit n=1 Tax=Novosphingobium sp. TaxID=1874826 RepID=UPI0026251C1B|nr:efflux RND transporter periplasmic adaptor subunit [Novosphingobium sp.]